MDTTEELYRQIVDPTVPIRRVTLTYNRVKDDCYQQYDLFCDPAEMEKERERIRKQLAKTQNSSRIEPAKPKKYLRPGKPCKRTLLELRMQPAPTTDDELVLVGDDTAPAQMAANDRQQRRYSGLRRRLKEEAAHGLQ